MDSNEIAFDNLSRLIEDTENLYKEFLLKIKTDEHLHSVVSNYFDSYEYKPKIIKGITSTLDYRGILINKKEWLESLVDQFSTMSNTLEIKGIIDTDEKNLKFIKKSIIENRIVPLLDYVVAEIMLCLKDVTGFNQKEVTTEEEIDFSDNNNAEKIIMLHKLGVLDFLQSQRPFDSSTNLLATAVSGITGIKTSTVQSYINPIYSSSVNQKNNPLKREKIVSKVIQKLISIHFKPSK